jgi:hypothetical protein
MAHRISEKNFTDPQFFVTLASGSGLSMGEFIEIGVNGASMQVVSGVFCAAALGIYALMQPDASDDDDSNGGGGGGLMQPIS